MKITIEKDLYNYNTYVVEKKTFVYETNEVSPFEAFQIINKALYIISINGKRDWKERMLGEGFEPTSIAAAAPFVYSIPAPNYQNFPGGSLLTGGTPKPYVTGENRVSAMTQADGQGDDSGTRGD